MRQRKLTINLYKCIVNLSLIINQHNGFDKVKIMKKVFARDEKCISIIIDNGNIVLMESYNPIAKNLIL